MNNRHKKLIHAIAQQIHFFYEHGIQFRVYHGSTNSTRTLSFDKDKIVDTSKLNKIISVNEKTKTAIVESNVSMDALVAATLQKGLIPAVVMEFPGITVGGGLQGGAGESSSYRCGTFNRIINWYEIILGNGTIMRVSPQKHSDLYWGAVGAYGSLGVVTMAEVQLIPARKYIVLDYYPVHSFSHAIDKLTDETKKKPDFIDGIMFSNTLGVVISGSLSNTSEAAERRFTRAYDDWFYLHAHKIAQENTKTYEKVPIADYHFRYDRGAFWMGALAFARFKIPFNRITRTLLNPLMHTRKMYTALQASNASQEYIIQDIALPKNKAVAFMEFVDTQLGIYPLWLCPLLVDNKSPLLSSYINTDLVINIGVWGKFIGNYNQFIKANKRLEEKVKELGGKKWLYAHMYYDQETFWSIYGGKKSYDTLRSKYKAEKLPDLYEKVSVTKRYPIMAKKGVLAAIFRR